jgi:hypothetical protein
MNSSPTEHDEERDEPRPSRGRPVGQPCHRRQQDVRAADDQRPGRHAPHQPLLSSGVGLPPPDRQERLRERDHEQRIEGLEPGVRDDEAARSAVDAGVDPEGDRVADLLVRGAEERHRQRDAGKQEDRARGHAQVDRRLRLLGPARSLLRKICAA